MSGLLRGRRPYVIAGAVSLFVGVVLLALAVGLPGSAEGSSTLGRVLTLSIQVVQNVVLWGDRALTDTQIRFNWVVVTLFLDELDPAQRRLLTRTGDLIAMLFDDLFSPLGLATLAALIAAYLWLRVTLDRRYPVAPRRRGPSEGS